MRFNTAIKHDAQGAYQETTLHLDCGHDVTYKGSPNEAEKQLRTEGGMISNTGRSRCRQCTIEYGQLLYDSLKALGR